mmetsp:Transcript_11066/g.22045  ORF Transcript_11066/g.22045 Transcript_11066/m.22045 type:complete len:184 (+) Transcript_11066:179-730(+)
MGAQCSSCTGEGQALPGVLLVGLDGSGGTTVLYRMRHGKVLQTVPTLSMNKETLNVDGVAMDIYDVGGSEKVRALWRQYSKLANGVIFVVDATDTQRHDLAAEELRKLFFGDGKKKSLIVPDLPLLILSNKQDVEGAIDSDALRAKFELELLPVRAFQIVPTSAKTGQGLDEAFKWMALQLRR